MLKLHSVTFKDDETDKIIDVQIPDCSAVNSNKPFTPDEYVVCCFYAGLLYSGGIDKLKEFMEK